jgi:hypothetical protein
MKLAAPTDRTADAIVLTIAVDRSDGIERVAFRCRIASALAAGASDEALLERLAPWMEREFEMTRETALKTIRTEHRLHDFTFDVTNRGPF